MTRYGLTCMALACAIAATASATRAETFTSLTVFGDSLSDTGNLFAVTSEAGFPTPESPPYFDGRFSNGPVWADILAEDFDAKGLESQNFAYGGARALPEADLLPDLPEQLGLFALMGSPDLGSRPIASLLFGANDIFGAIATPELDAVAMAAANAVADAAVALSGFGFGDFVIFNLPDLGRTPLFSLYQPGAAPFASAATVAFNATLDGRVDGLRAGGLNVVEIDMYALLNEMFDDPAAFGVTDVTQPCLPPGTLIACIDDDQTDRAFFDSIHPNFVIHDRIAGIVSAQVAPVPLPASALLLLAGIAGLVGFRRRA